MSLVPAAVGAPEAAVREFIGRINAHDVEGIVALCTAEYRLVDGGPVEGRHHV